MISVVIPTLNAADRLGATLAALVPAAVDGLVKELVITDGGSTDATLEIAGVVGARLVLGSAGRGAQLAAGCAAARGDWLLVLHADTVLQPGWEGAVKAHLARPADRAGYFRFAFDDEAVIARVWERGVALRCRMLRLPYGDQGLLISRKLYDAVGGYRPLALMEDVDLVRRIGAGRLKPLAATAVTSAARFQAQGYVRRSARNLGLLTQFLLGGDPAELARRYG